MPKIDESLIKKEELTLKAGTLKYSKKEMFRIAAFRKALRQGQIPGEARAIRMVERTDKKTGNKYLMKLNPKKYPIPNLTPAKTPKYRQLKLRKSLTPGTIGILLRGNHRAKRVVFIRQVDCGLLLVCNPLTGCPPRTIDHKYFLATKMKLDVSGIKVPEEMTHTYFHNKKAENRAFQKALKKSSILGGDKPVRKAKELTPEKMAINKKLADQVADLIKAHPDPIFVRYMKALFKLGPRDYPHRMLF